MSDVKENSEPTTMYDKESYEIRGGSEKFEDIEEVRTFGTEAISQDTTGRAALLPRPSADPNDPLNWNRREKYLTFLTICFFSFLATVNASKFTVAIVPLAKEFHVSSTKAGYLVCFNLLFLGVGNLFWVPLMRSIGKRPVYLLALPLFFAANLWSYFAKGYNSLLAASIISGFAASSADATVPAVVADLFFVHERGAMMMIFHTALSCGFFLGPLINAYVEQYSGWRWICGWLAIVVAAVWVIGIFTIHETTYLGRDTSAPASSFRLKRTFKEKMSLSHGQNKNTGFFRSFNDTLMVATYPGVLWAGITVGTFVGWNIVVQLTASRTFTAPPYSWEIHSLGLLSLSGFIGAILAIFFGGALIDRIANSLTARHGGLREPEYRLPAIVIPAFMGPIGVLIFGLTLVAKTMWIGPAVGYAMQGFGLTAVSNVVVTYAVDSYLPLAGEALVVVFVVRGIIGTVLALWAANWLAIEGKGNAFGEMVGIQYFVILFAIIFWVWGKRIRGITMRYGPMKRISRE